MLELQSPQKRIVKAEYPSRRHVFLNVVLHIGEASSCVMSAIGTKRTYETYPSMSAFGGKADIIIRERHVRL
jgi:hypothetical protein